MKELNYTISIAAPRQKVWDTMLLPETYKIWAGAAWPASHYIGEWKAGAHIRFLGSEDSGTLANITTYQPYEQVSAAHIAVLLPGGVEDRESDMAKTWVGSTESYNLTEADGLTRLSVLMCVYPAWEE